MLGFILVTLLFIGALIGFNKLLDMEEIKRNWPKYRCRPDVILTASLYGKDAAENFDFCLTSGFKERAGAQITPFYSFLSIFTGTMMTMLSSINSIRMTFATIVGSVTQIFKEFGNRIQILFSRIQVTGIRMKYMMGRIFATMYAMIFMMMSGIKATTNFGNTFLFKFLDTFCFDPDTPVLIREKGEIPIRDCVIGDIFEQTGDRVTATFQFMSDGQPMVLLPGPVPILVSTNHYLLHNGKWIKSVDHPDAQPALDWSGGAARPLICLNTDSHSFPVGSYIFRDYDEAGEADYETAESVLKQLNSDKTGQKQIQNYFDYTTCCSSDTNIRLATGQICPASELTLGTQLSHGQITGLVKKECSYVCKIGRTTFTPGTAVWSESDKAWKRASDLAPVIKLAEPIPFYSFVVTSACIETEDNIIFRDYVEIHSPDTENIYTEVLRSL